MDEHEAASMSGSSVSGPLLDSLKAELLRIPVSAWVNASKRAADHRIKGEARLADIYVEIANQLVAEGYASDPDSGQLGCATRQHYITGVMGD
jgi:hypothetical protein